MFYQTQTERKPPLACTPVALRLRRNGPVSCCTWFAAYGTRVTMHCQWGWLSSFPGFVPGDLDIQTRPSEGTNTNLFSRCRDIWATNGQKSHRQR